jgi:hypothetical protein
MRRVILPAVIALLCSAFFGQERAPETTAPLPERETQVVLPVGELLPEPVNSTFSAPQSG